MLFAPAVSPVMASSHCPVVLICVMRGQPEVDRVRDW
jgi:hypothetical protein